jgi:hypothetical protein
VIVAGIVNAVTGEKIENAAPVRSEKLRSGAALVGNVHLEKIEQFYPLRIYVVGVGVCGSGAEFGNWHSSI